MVGTAGTIVTAAFLMASIAPLRPDQPRSPLLPSLPECPTSMMVAPVNFRSVLQCEIARPMSSDVAEVFRKDPEAVKAEARRYWRQRVQALT